MAYVPNEARYQEMPYRRVGRSGLKLPAFSLGLWHNFGGVDAYEKSRELALGAFDLGITHFDLANVYGPPVGSTEEMFGRLLRTDLAPYRDELIVSTKAAGRMFDGPYGEGGSRKTLLSALDRSLQRLGIDYVDIWYTHGYDPETPLEETMAALDTAVRQGKALYVGISNHNAEQSAEAIRILRSLGTPLLIHQPQYNLFDRTIEQGLLDVLEENGVGSIVFSPLMQGLLTGKYVRGIPDDSRANSPTGQLRKEWISERGMQQVERLGEIARERGQTISQLALAWVLRGGRVTSALLGASRVEQLRENVASLNAPDFSEEELRRIDDIMA